MGKFTSRKAFRKECFFHEGKRAGFLKMPAPPFYCYGEYIFSIDFFY